MAALSLSVLAISIGQGEAARADLATRLDTIGVSAGKFVFGKEASQGPREWYLGTFRMRLRLASAGPTGNFDLEASVDGFSSNYVRGRVFRGGRCRGRGLVLESVDLLRGRWKEVRCGPSVQVTSRNFLQNRSVRPGTSTYRIAADDLSTLGIEATLLSSGIRSSPRGAGRLAIATAKGKEVEVRAGEWEGVQVALVNRGDRPLRNLTGRVSVEGAAVKPELAVPAEIGAHSRHLSRFWIRAPHRGVYGVTVTALSNSNSPAAEFELVIEPRKRSSLSGDLRLAAVILAAMATLGFLSLWLMARVGAPNDEPWKRGA